MKPPEWLVGEIFQVSENGGPENLYLCVGFDDGKALLHLLTPLEKVLIQSELGTRQPFAGRIPGIWLASRLQQLVN